MPATAEVISLSEELASIRGRLLQRFAREVGEKAFARAGAYDEDGAYPAADVAALHESGLITAVFPPEFGGAALSGSVSQRGPAVDRFGQPAFGAAL